MMAIKPKDMVKIVDYTILDPKVTVRDVKEVCDQAKEYNFAAVCVNPCYVPLTAKLLEGSSVKVCTVVGYPLGSNTSETKAFETKSVIRDGAQEIDMVVNIGTIKEHNWPKVKEDIKAVIDATKIAGVTRNIITKVILETNYLTDEEIENTCSIIKKLKVDFIEVSSGFDQMAIIDDVSLIRKLVGRSIGVKASGGINDFDYALDMLDAGANRIGTSSGIAIVTGEEDE